MMFPYDQTLAVAQTCLCLHAQRAARALTRHFDEVFRALDLTSGQFSLMMALNRPTPPTVGELAPFLAMDRTTLTAQLKPLQRRGWVDVAADRGDRRKRRVVLTAAGHALLHRAHPIWLQAHAALEQAVPTPDELRAQLMRLAAAPTPVNAAPAGSSYPPDQHRPTPGAGKQP
ncbi:MarR family winged helix-turn-helix transcriptional regulator [Chitiniphilus purpureus]|uniref:MarR family winged helix-turn-helix transcriptional regulator n=1 Tax=Chitiniphilus purpureus TaxID=2981137 RepID=A0ABY6DYJ8_9NEIS|nr:MarR family winged helix-turn-helix transcriptional regulator [Chitiniphilus sp. CD1]UXY16918.1 MarR family winged helix-turn-helix transcriptional regulator [Chitiniphilus sp. CD1]